MLTDDIIAIEQLLNRYCFAVDKGTADDVAALFHESAVLKAIYAGDPPASGRAAIHQWYVNYHKQMHSTVDHLRHCISNPLVEVSGNEASAQCYLTADAVAKPTGKPFWVAGYYRDKLVKEGGRWFFKEREIHVHYQAQSEPRK
ncbi:MAG TPA: nuclear transport factor 2 family protein [Candidatus Binataceae bacterium]|nr:nuclear transport factor 2 family protein [Candidatus Binataceae bacterium]